jgi:hypothetical protein
VAYGVERFPAEPSIILSQDPEVSIWALQKEDASNRLPLPWRVPLIGSAKAQRVRLGDAELGLLGKVERAGANP